MKIIHLLKGLGAGAAAGYLAAQLSWTGQRLRNANARRSLENHTNLANKGYQLIAQGENASSTFTHSIEDGIERIVYIPTERRFATPIVMQHGMWHGAWCWRAWQELLAEWGWESHAHSLPGHAGSPVQRAIGACTLDYYLGFLKAEVERLGRKPVLMGHSMGGALTQWYLKHVGDDLPAAVLVAPWPADSLVGREWRNMLRLDALGCAMIVQSWDAWPLVRNPQVAARLLLGPQAVVDPVEWHAQLCRESSLVMLQHSPFYWQPPSPIQTPMLIYAGEIDAGIQADSLRQSAAFYGCDFLLAERAGHNLMMDHNYRQTAWEIHNWLVARCIP